MTSYIIGIDTGGTFTDAVLMDPLSKKVIATSKTPTTHNELANSTGEALCSLLENSRVSPEQISSVTLSSTLATNTVVENRGARVAILVIGYVRHFKLPVKAVVYLKGGHSITGKEEEPLEIEYLVEMVTRLKGEVDAYGVCSAMSIKNPSHELVAEKAISMIDPKPVFCSHRASTVAGMKERAATAGLHAKLMPVMQEYLKGVQAAMDRLELKCPVTIVSGNGKTIAADKAVEFAGTTVASGPACTASFGLDQVSGEALVIDVGGTTTDIALLKNGQLTLTQDGCRIGDWQTHVEAVDMVTGGIGGDSFAAVSEKSMINLGPARVVPISMAADCPPVQQWLGAGEKAKLVIRHHSALTDPGDEVETFLRTRCHGTAHDIRQATGIAGITLEKKLERLTHLQQIYECGFTPTDSLHVLDRIQIGNREAAWKAAEILGRSCNLDPVSFSKLILARAQEKIETLILEYIAQHHWGSSLNSFLSQRNTHPVLGVEFSLKIPLIGIGAAARYLLPEVATHLHSSVIFPDNAEVGNAIGAAMIGSKSLHER